MEPVYQPNPSMDEEFPVVSATFGKRSTGYR